VITLSSKADYALRALFDLASRPPGECVRIADIAGRQNIPRKFLEAILLTLRQGGYVESRRGAEGGYRLTRAPRDIPVGEVLRFIDGPQHRTALSGAETPFGDMWRAAEQAVSMVVDGTTFADLLRKWEEKRSVWIPAWDI
jgi:Rrf2 family protein